MADLLAQSMSILNCYVIDKILSSWGVLHNNSPRNLQNNRLTFSYHSLVSILWSDFPVDTPLCIYSTLPVPMYWLAFSKWQPIPNSSHVLKRSRQSR